MPRKFALLLLLFSPVPLVAQLPPPPLPPAVGNAVLLATNSIQVDRNVVVTRGDLVVNFSSTSPILGEKDLSLDQGVQTPSGFAVKADSVDLDGGAIVGGDVYFNTLVNNGTIAGAQITPLALPVIDTLPELPNRASGTETIAVGNGEMRIIGRGDYGTLSIGRDATVRFPGGPYTFASITMERGATIVWDGPGDVIVNGPLAVGQSASIVAGPGITTKHKMIFVHGDVTIGKTATISATIDATDGRIDAGDGLTLTGSFVARDIHISRDSTLTLRSGFRNLPPHADDITVRVGRDPVVITLTGSDPDLDPLQFSIGLPPVNGTLGPVLPSGPTSAVVVYTPNGAGVNDVFTFRVTDSEAFFDDGVVLINDGLPLPGPPTTITAQRVDVEIPPGRPAILSLPVIAPPGTPITVSIVSGSGPFHGTLGEVQQPTMDPPRPAQVVYAPAPGYIGEDTFSFQACGTLMSEEGPVEVCSIAPVNLVITGPEEGELAPDLTVTVDSGVAALITLPVGEGPAQYRVLSLPSNGTLKDSNGAVITSAPATLPSPIVTYQSGAGFGGQVTFVYEVTAGQTTDTGTVTINVNPPPDNGR